MELVRDGNAMAALVVGRDATWLERHAAEELQRYLAAISGATLPVVDVPPTGDLPRTRGPLVLIGRAETNPLIAGAIRQGIVCLSPDDPGLDGFIIQTTRMDRRDVVVLGGSMDRGTLYAVYALLEDVLDVGLFRDGERIPRLATVELGDLRIAQRPRFADREDGLVAYSSMYWKLDDWRRELDWKAKRRANIIWPFHTSGEITSEILADWGILPAPPPRRQEPTVYEQAHEYARKLGMQVPCNLPNGALPEAFFAARPECRTLLLQWSEYAPYRQLHPADPLFRRLIVEYVRRYRERYGTDHLYIAEFASESRILEGAENVQEARLIFARELSEALLEADPEAVWVPSSWSFDLSADDPANPWQPNWTPADIREYLDAIACPLVVWDTWAEEAAKYLRTDYFYGHPWGFAVLHCFGGETYLHGDLADVIDRVHALDDDPRGARCDLFLSLPEHVDYNSVYFELCAALAWDPRRVSLDGFLRSYRGKRYGREWTDATEPAWQLLLETVYGPDSGTVKIIMDPLYWFRPDLRLLHGWVEDDERATALWRRRPAFIPKLRCACETFLACPDLLAASEMARRDLVDIARQWIAERFNQALIAARDAFLAGDSARLKAEAAQALPLLDDQARLLASWPPYRLDRQIEQAQGFYPDPVASVKRFHVWCNPTEGQESVPLRDYYRMDLDGLVADYYRPRVAAYLDLLRRKLAAGEREISDAEFDATYTPVERAFIAAPMHRLPEGEDPVRVVRDLLAADAAAA